MKDILGQSIEVGSLVIPTNSSSISFYKDPFVITRLGASTLIQINGGSYIESSLVISVDEQLKSFKGQQYVIDLKEKYKEVFNYNQVENKKPINRFLIQKTYTTVQTVSNNYCQYKAENISYWLIEVPAKKEDRRNWKSVVSDMIDEKYQGLGYVTKRNLLYNKFEEEYLFTYSGTAFSRKAINTAFPGIEQCINMEITDPYLIEQFSKFQDS